MRREIKEQGSKERQRPTCGTRREKHEDDEAKIMSLVSDSSVPQESKHDRNT